MRIRHIKGAEEYIAAHPLVVPDPCRFRGSWAASAFTENNPLELEIGCGMGAFLREKSLRHPERNFIGIELNSTVLYKAVKRYEAALAERGTGAPANLRFIRSDARLIGGYFAPAEVSAVYIHFPDPWPKDKNAGKRLTSPRFLALYEDILVPGGILSLRTDNQGLFEYSRGTLSSRGWEMCAVGDPRSGELRPGRQPRSARSPGTDPIPGSMQSAEDPDSDILTEYETKFISLGMEIYSLRAKSGTKQGPQVT